MKLYEKLLPSLDLKRKQLTAEQKKAQKKLAEKEIKVREATRRIGEELPMLAFKEIQTSGLLKIKKVHITEENIVGVHLPTLEKIDFEIADYSFFTKPQWIDALVDKLKNAAYLRLDVIIARERVKRLAIAVRRLTQRVNLFEKKLIPEAKENIKKIRIFLGDAERSAVIRSKLAKAKHEKEEKVFEEISA